MAQKNPWRLLFTKVKFTSFSWTDHATYSPALGRLQKVFAYVDLLYEFKLLIYLFLHYVSGKLPFFLELSTPFRWEIFMHLFI